LLELLNKVWDLANLIEDRFSCGYAKTVVLSCFQRWSRASGLACEKTLDHRNFINQTLQMFTDLSNANNFAYVATTGQVTSIHQMIHMLYRRIM
jgi:hypothetical protein